MSILRRFTAWFSATFRKQKFVGKVVLILVSVMVLCCVCSLPIALLNPTDRSENIGAPSNANAVSEAEAQDPVQVTERSTKTLSSTSTPKPTNTPKPTSTPLPPTATPDPNIVSKGMHMVGSDIRPGFYRGESDGFDLFDSCYWARLKDTSGDLGSILANENSIGQFYLEVLPGDFALETRCSLYYLEKLPDPAAEFPQKLAPGTYLVGIDMQPGQYKGQAGEDIMDSCYWARLKNVTGSLTSINANDIASGQFYVNVSANDFAFHTKCELERVGD
jgi:hypothetical protein